MIIIAIPSDEQTAEGTIKPTETKEEEWRQNEIKQLASNLANIENRISVL